MRPSLVGLAWITGAHNRVLYRALVKMNTAHRNTHDIFLEELNGLGAIRDFLVADAGR